MEKEKKLFSYLSSVFAFCFLALLMFLPDAKAEAALSVDNINYENSTITIHSDSGDKILYFSDKNKKKWETALVGFEGENVTMDISWIALTKDYKITFKGDKTTEDILEVTIPKQEKTFKAKYNLKTKEVTFTNAGERTIEYRKNNTDTWTETGTASDANNKVSVVLERLAENGGSVYFRLKSEAGSASDAGERPSKEVACKVTKKSAAPTVSVDTSALTINVKSGWQVRKVNGKMEEKSNGFSFMTGDAERISDLANKYGDGFAADESDKWFTFHSEKDVPLSVLASEAVGSGMREDVYLQFRKAATTSTQVSYTTTVKIPAQEETPENVTSIEYTSATSCNLVISAASSAAPYEYCVVAEDEMDGNHSILSLEDVSWNTVSSAAPVQFKKSKVDNGSYIFYRKKAVGKVGDDSFALPTPEKICNDISEKGLQYLGDLSITKIEKTTYEGACKEDNSAAYITFSFPIDWNDKVKAVTLGKTPGVKGDVTTVIDSKVTKNSVDNKYQATVTIKQINVSSDIETMLKSTGKVPLYAYIEFENNEEPFKSDANNGIIITMVKKSVIRQKSEAVNPTDDNYSCKAERFIGSEGEKSLSEFWFELAIGDDTKTQIKEVYLGSKKLAENTDWTYDSGTDKFTVKLAQIEKELNSAYYNTEQNLIINLSNGEKLSEVTVKLIEPISLKKKYSWAFTQGRLATEKVTERNDDGKPIATESAISYTVEYVPYEKEVNGLKVTDVTLEKVELAIGGTTGSIWAGTEGDDSKKVVFSNEKLNGFPQGSGNVKFQFKIEYNNEEQNLKDYAIEKGCFFTIL